MGTVVAVISDCALLKPMKMLNEVISFFSRKIDELNEAESEDYYG